nr:hypothetical protein [Ktedonobacteraceae bacterium]
MVNQEQEVIERVHHERMNTEPLSGAFVPFGEESLLGGSKDVFDIENIGLHATTGGSFVTPTDGGESYVLFAKLQDEE